jgi:hypothetical protein
MLNPDFRDMLSALCDEGVEFLLVGAYALAAHGRPRATGDLDNPRPAKKHIPISNPHLLAIWLARYLATPSLV